MTPSAPAAPPPRSGSWVGGAGPWSPRRGSGGRSPAIRRALRRAPRRPAGAGLRGWKDADDVGAALDLLVQPFQRIGRPDLLPVACGEAGEREQVVGGLAQHRL